MQEFIINQILVLLSTMQKQERWQMLKELCINQNIKFKKWHEQKQFNQFHSSHYDWWAFPINRNSSYGNKYKVFYEDKPFLDKDEQFISALRSNSILVCNSWGYDLQRGQLIKQKHHDQCWQDWPIRLYKLANSLEYFNQQDLFINAIKYGLMLIQKGEQFSYGPKNLKPLFFKNQNKAKEKLKIKQENSQAKIEKQCFQSKQKNIQAVTQEQQQFSQQTMTSLNLQKKQNNEAQQIK